MPRKQLPPDANRVPPYHDPRRYMNGHEGADELVASNAHFNRPARHGFPASWNGNGRASGYQPHYADMAYQLRLLGATNRMISNALNISETTLHRWWHNPSSRIPEFADAMDAGGYLADARMAMSTFHRGLGYEHPDEKIMVVNGEVVRVPTTKHYPPDTGAAIFWLTNRQKQFWRNRTSTELTGEDGAPLLPPQLVIQGVEPDPPDNHGNGNGAA